MEKKPMFYGGKVGPWIPVLLMLAGMLASTIIGGGGLNRLTGISFFAISVGFLLCKDKKQFGKITLKGLQNPMLGTILMAYLMAGMLACSAETQTQIDRQVVALVKRQHEKALQILHDNREKLDELANFLYEKETITGEQFMQILNG